ncbi:MAG: hypothetical protein ACLFOY_14125 [Desulfatibacillaceae bacterium]
MKQYVVDQLRPEDYDNLKEHLDKKYGESRVGGLYWIPLDMEFLGDVQAAHTDCQPFYFAIELETTRLSCELLIRTLERMRCDCIRYADQRQTMGIITFVDQMCDELGVEA